jgi:hypothetical protein
MNTLNYVDTYSLKKELVVYIDSTLNPKKETIMEMIDKYTYILDTR